MNKFRFLPFSIALIAAAFSARATFYPSAATGPGSDSDGSAARWQVVQAINETDALIVILSSDTVDVWPDGWKKYRGTAFATSALSSARTVRSALADLRTNWDRLSVQTVSLSSGWNAFYVYVDDPAPMTAVLNPSAYVDRIRGSISEQLPSVDAAAEEILSRVTSAATVLVETRQKLIGAYVGGTVSDLPMESLFVLAGSTATDASSFSTDSSVEVQAVDPWMSWFASAPESLNAASISSGRICMGVNTSGTTRVFAFLGQCVRSGSMNWHRTGGTDKTAEWNFFGISLVSPSSLVKATEVFGLSPDITIDDRMRIGGNDQANPTFKSVNVASEGGALVCSASGSSSWYPAPTVSPQDEVTFAAGEDTASFTLKNDTAAAQVVTGCIFRSGIRADALTELKGVQYRENSFLAWKEWNFSGEGVSSNLYFAASLAAGESRTFQLRFDRTKFDTLARKREHADDFNRGFGAVMRFQYGSCKFCNYLGVFGEPDNGAVTAAWPVGLWAGTLTLNRVSCVKGNQSIVHDVPAGGTMRTRVIVHVDDDSKVRLLHHVLLQSVSVTNAAGGVSVVTSLYAAKAKPTSTSGTLTRLDAIAMDIDNPVVDGNGKLDNEVSFSWKIAADGRANPFRHPYHPEHDGLEWDFETPAPDGDDVNNYRQGQIKPETWSISNKLELKTNADSIEERDETITGTCTWTLGNMRRQVNGEDIRASGTFVLERLQSVGTLNK